MANLEQWMFGREEKFKYLLSKREKMESKAVTVLENEVLTEQNALERRLSKQMTLYA